MSQKKKSDMTRSDFGLLLVITSGLHLIQNSPLSVPAAMGVFLIGTFLLWNQL